MYRKIFLTGGTGFVGTEILRKLVENGYRVKLLVHEKKPKVNSKLIETVKCDLLDKDALVDCMKGCNAVINLVGIIKENPSKGATFEKMHVETTGNLIEAAKKNRIKRFIQMSSNQSEKRKTAYQKTKWKAEQMVKNSNLTYTIFKPSLIFGRHDKFVSRLSQLMKTYRIIPYFGDGNYRLQPVSVTTVAEAFVKSIENKNAFNKVYCLGGPVVYTYKEFLDAVARINDVKIIKVPFPLFEIRILTALFGWLPQFPITREQLTMLLESNVCDSDEAKQDLKIELYGF